MITLKNIGYRKGNSVKNSSFMFMAICAGKQAWNLDGYKGF